jgi:hypothetical protein
MDRNTQEIAETLACAAGIYSSIRISLKCGLTKTPDYSSQISQIHESEALVITVIFYTSGEKRPGPTNWFDWQGAHGTNTR